MSNIQNIHIKVSGLNPYDKYSFHFNNKGGNWPIRVSPLSGEFTVANKDSVYEVKTYVYFCPTTGLCPPSDTNVFFNTPASDELLPGIDVGSESLYSVLGLSIKEKSTNDVIFTYPCVVECTDCAPKLGISVDPITMDADTGSSTTFVAKLSGLIPNQPYMYRFNTTTTNWPVSIVPQSGYIQTPNNEYDIKALVSFCRAEGSCLSGEVGVLGAPDMSACKNGEEIYAMLEAELVPVDTTYQVATKSSIPVVCDKCIPTLGASLPRLIELTQRSANKTAFTAEINNLIIGAEYSYRFEGVNCNWPAVMYPISGTFVATTTDVKIPAKLTFCYSTGVCPASNTDVLPYSLDSACSYSLGDFDKVARVKLVVDQLGCNNSISTQSNELTIICDDCVPTPKVVLPKMQNLDSVTFNTTAFSANVNNLVTGAEYYYEFSGVDSNWPTTIYPMSGTFIADATDVEIPAQLTFCRTTGVWSGNSADTLLPYSLSQTCSYAIADQDLYTRLRLTVNPISCDSSHTTSNDMLVRCHDCLPKVVINHATLSDTLSGAGNLTYRLATTVDNLVVGEQYIYNINYIDSNWPTVVSKQSGEFLAVSDTKNIHTDIAFCFPSGSCALDNRDAFQNHRSNVIYNNSNIKFLNINMSVTTKDCVTPTYTSQDFSLVCDNCLPSTNFNAKITGSPILTLGAGCCSGTRLLSTVIDGGIPGELHTYSLSCPNPEVTFSPASGTIVLRQGGSGTIMSLMTTALDNKEQAIVECKVVNTVSNLETVDFLVVRCGPECNN